MAQRRRQPSKRYNKKQSFRTLALIVTFICFLAVIILIGIALYSLKEQKKVMPTNEAGAEVEVESINNQLKEALIRNHLNIDSLDEYKVFKSKGFINVYYKIIVDDNTYEPLKTELYAILSNNGYKISSSNLLLASKENININVELFLKELQKVVPEKKPEPQIHKYTGKIAIILDDGGNSLDLAKKVALLPYPVTVSILPFTPYDKETAKILRKANKKVFLHIPLQPYGYPDIDPGKGSILLNTPRDLIDIIINKDIERIGHIDGANNHMGSIFTENKDKTTLVLKSLARYSKVFVDSRTTNKSTAYSVCNSIMAVCGYNHLFLDNENDKNAIIKKIDEGYKLAQKNGSIIVIGHLRHPTVEALTESMPVYNDKGIKFVFVDEAI